MTTVTPFYRRRIDNFTRWMLKAEAKQRAKNNRLAYDQEEIHHSRGSPSCMGGWLETYGTQRGWVEPTDWSAHVGLPYVQMWYGGKFNDGVFGVQGCNGAKTALQAVNYLRRLVGLPRLYAKDARP